MYRYETHLHTSPASAGGRASAAESVVSASTVSSTVFACAETAATAISKSNILFIINKSMNAGRIITFFVPVTNKN